MTGLLYPLGHPVRLDGVADFLGLGVRHILSGPDHILFVLSLLLAFVSLREVLRLTLTFTVAHSVTLLLAGAGLLTLSSDIVEPIIAFSISFMAIAPVFFSDRPFLGTGAAKIGVVFFFGLFHGLGFAGALEETEVPRHEFVADLLAFDVGVEVGQLFILALAVPLIYAIRKFKWYKHAMQGTAVAIGTTGVLWGVQRIAGIG